MNCAEKLLEPTIFFNLSNFDLINTYFGIDVGHKYDGINVTA